MRSALTARHGTKKLNSKRRRDPQGRDKRDIFLALQRRNSERFDFGLDDDYDPLDYIV